MRSLQRLNCNTVVKSADSPMFSVSWGFRKVWGQDVHVGVCTHSTILSSPFEPSPDQKSGSPRRAELLKCCLYIFWSMNRPFQSNFTCYLLGMIQEREKFLNKGKVVMEITSFCFLIWNPQSLQAWKCIKEEKTEQSMENRHFVFVLLPAVCHWNKFLAK